jgi:hypothetical protein
MAAAPSAASPPSHLHAAFLSILPRIERHGRITFRGLVCPQRRDDAVAEMVALCWRWFVRLIERGKDPLTFPTVLASYAARAVKCGRRLCGQEKGKDALSPLAQQRHGFTVAALPTSTRVSQEERYRIVHGQHEQDEFEERLRDNTQTPVLEQVAFRLDFPAWLATLTGRERRLVREMARNERTKDLSQRFELSPARISQLRRELHDDWSRFCGLAATATSRPRIGPDS